MRSKHEHNFSYSSPPDATEGAMICACGKFYTDSKIKEYYEKEVFNLQTNEKK